MLTPSGEEGEERHRDACRERVHQVRYAGPRGDFLALVAGRPQDEPHGDARDGGVDAAVVHQGPNRDTERYVKPPAADPEPLEQVEDSQACEGSAQRPEVQVAGEEDRDDEDGAEVVDDGQGEQEGAQGGGEVGGDDGEDSECESDVGGHRHGPAVEAAAPRPAVSAYRAAGTIMPHAAATTGRAAVAGVRSSPTTSSRLSSMPTRKKTARSPSAVQCPTDSSSPRAGIPKWKSRIASYPRSTGCWPRPGPRLLPPAGRGHRSFRCAGRRRWPGVRATA